MQHIASQDSKIYAVLHNSAFFVDSKCIGHIDHCFSWPVVSRMPCMACQFVNDTDAFAACLCHCKFTTQMCPKFRSCDSRGACKQRMQPWKLTTHILVCMTLN